jgi:hypothetical protein
VLLQSAPMARALQTGTPTGTPTDQAWRVIALLNVFRLIVPMVLLLVFFFDAPTRSVGSHLPGLFLGVTIAYFTFALVSIQTIQWRSPSVQWQALVQLSADAIAMALLIHASGGITSGLATLLVLPAGATATIVERRYALLGTSIITLALLAETTFSAFQGEAPGLISWLPALPARACSRSRCWPFRMRGGCARARRWSSSARSTSPT